MSRILIQHIEVTDPAGQASLEFSNIPQTYSDLLIVCSMRSNRTDAIVDNLQLGINGQALNLNIGTKIVYGTGSVADSGTFNVAAGGLISTNAATANTFGNSLIYIPEYTGANAKSISTDSASENNAVGAYHCIVASLWNQAAPISSIVLDPSDGSLLVQHSSATLYGITAGSDGTTTVS